MKKILLIGYSLCFAVVLKAQDTQAVDAIVKPNGDALMRVKNIIYFESGGNGVFYSVNYERILTTRRKIKMGCRAGISYAYGDKKTEVHPVFVYFSLPSFLPSFYLFGSAPGPVSNYGEPIFISKNSIHSLTSYTISSNGKSYFFFPLSFHLIFGTKHSFDTGTGVTLILRQDENLYGSRLFFYFGMLSYRYQGNNGFFCRVGITPAIKIFDFKREVLFNTDEYIALLGMSIGKSF